MKLPDNPREKPLKVFYKHIRKRSNEIPHGLISLFWHRGETSYLFQRSSEINVFEFMSKQLKEIGLSAYEIQVSELSKKEYRILESGVVDLKINEQKNGI